jgi:general secretion pathway protein L
MPMMKDVLGLDLGSHTIKAVEFRQTLRGLEPVQLRLHPLADPDAPPAETLSRFLRMHQLPTEHVTCAIPGDRLSTRRLRFPFRDRKKLAQAVPFEVEGQIPFDLDEVIADWEIVGGDRSHAEVVATIAPRVEVARLLELLRAAGCEPRVLEAEGLVLGNLAPFFGLFGTRLLADIGHRKTNLCLLRDGSPVASRTVPVGGRALSEAIAKDRHLELADAERAKCEDGIFHLGFESTAPGAVAVLERLAREIVRFLESLEPVLGGAAEARVAGLVLFGGTARLHRIDEYLAERTGIAASRLALPPDAAGSAVIASGDPLVLAPAIALALRGTAEARTRMNFRQGAFAYRTDLRQFLGPDLRPTAWLGAAALGLLAIATATSIGLESRRAGRLESELARQYGEAFPGRPAPENAVAAMRSAVSEAHQRAEFLGVYRGNLSALDLLTELSRTVPPDLDVRFGEIAIDRNAIRVDVHTKSFEAADRLRAVLAANPTFADTRVTSEIASDKSGGKSFNLSIRLGDREKAS